MGHPSHPKTGQLHPKKGLESIVKEYDTLQPIEKPCSALSIPHHPTRIRQAPKTTLPIVTKNNELCVGNL